jgi:uncharacterized membrane protein
MVALVFRVNPFDLQKALFARHAQHVVLVHFPIALFIVGVAFDMLAQWRKRAGLAAAAYCNLAVAAFSTLPVVATGLLAWRFQLEGQELKGILLLHLIFGCVASGMIWLVWFVHFRTRRTGEGVLPRYRIAIELVAVSLVAIAGHLGGFLSGVNGP